MATTPDTATAHFPEPEDNQPEEMQEDSASAPEGYGDWNETLPDELQGQLKKLVARFCEEFKYSRRLEIMAAWKSRSFWREMQHLTWNWDGECWDSLGPAGAGATTNASYQKQNSAVLYTTNIFQGYGDAYLAIITQAAPSVRFEPEDPEDPADIDTAKAAEPLRKMVQHENDPIELMTKAAYYAWTDGRLHGWTRWAIDSRTGVPRVTQTILGAMEVKVPILYESQDDYPYIQYASEHHISQVRAKVQARSFPTKDYYKKVSGGSSGDGEDVYERSARISVKQGISMRSAGDAKAYGDIVTTQRTWLRPEAFYDPCVSDEYQEDLLEVFSKGCYVEFDNGVYTGSQERSMDDEWAVVNVMEGDGGYRPAKGTCMVSVQERANDICNIAQDIYEKTQPASHWDDKIFDVDGMKHQVSAPGERHGYNADEMAAGDQVGGHVFFEPAAAVSPDMLQYLKELMTDVPEFLTGISAILFGSDSGGDKSGKALSIQQSAAMGRIGLSFRVMKRFYARMMEQAVRCACQNLDHDVSRQVPDNKGGVETLQVRVEDLGGNIRCYPESDENMPESWTQKSSRLMQLIQESNLDPAMKAILMHPRNQELAKRYIGLEEFEIPDADSWIKQLSEINIMLDEGAPVMDQEPPKMMPNPVVPNQPELVQPPPAPVSTIPVDPDYDNHAAEFQTVMDWINSSIGQKAKAENPEGFQNVRLHGLEHKKCLMAAMAAAQAAAPAAPAKGAPAPPKPQPAQV